MTAGQDLVVIGTIGLKGASALAVWGEAELKKRFSPSFVRRCQMLFLLNAEKLSFLGSETGTASASVVEADGERKETKCLPIWKVLDLDAYGVTSCCAVGDGGILTALWDYFDTFSLGFELELRRIPVLQETIEVCEVFEVNPYRLQSEGCILATAANGGALVRALNRQGISAAVIGRTTKQIARRIYHGETETFLDKPTEEELERIQATGGKR